jgi:hypothetical protein
MSMDSADDELNIDVVVEERRLEAHNEAEDARCLLLGPATIDLDGVGTQPTQTYMGSTSPTADASTFVPERDKRSRRRAPISKVWLHFEDVTAMQNGKEVRVSATCLHCKNESDIGHFSGYIGHLIPAPSRNESDLSTVFLHQRCACHIINLIVKSCLKRLQPYLEDFRTAITFLNSSNQRIASYKQYCMSVGVRPRKFGVDMDVRWNSTFLMLKHLVPYHSTFSVWIRTNYPCKEDGSF